MIKLKDILNEQFGIPSGRSIYPSYQAVRSYEEPVTKAVNSTMDWINRNKHTILDVAALGALFIFPPAAVAIELTNAGLYFKEGDKLLGSLSIIFAALPLIGEIPGVKQSIGFALKKGFNYSLKEIKKILETISKNVGKIKQLFGKIKNFIQGKGKRPGGPPRETSEIRRQKIKKNIDMLISGEMSFEDFITIIGQ